ncbi:MAG TPA: hypothetical protein VFV48_03385 [Pseudomonadales bacterium]|nr:hypothetical protein [Pseudomonadales bacterium]
MELNSFLSSFPLTPPHVIYKPMWCPRCQDQFHVEWQATCWSLAKRKKNGVPKNALAGWGVEVEIQEACLDDAEEILTLQRTAYVSEAVLHDDFEIPPLTQTLEELISDFAHKKILKITENGSLSISAQSMLVFCAVCLKASSTKLVVGTDIALD